MKTVLNPYAKLEWFIENYSPEFAAQVKFKLFEAVCALIFGATSPLNLK